MCTLSDPVHRFQRSLVPLHPRSQTVAQRRKPNTFFVCPNLPRYKDLTLPKLFWTLSLEDNKHSMTRLIQDILMLEWVSITTQKCGVLILHWVMLEQREAIGWSRQGTLLSFSKTCYFHIVYL